MSSILLLAPQTPSKKKKGHMTMQIKPQVGFPCPGITRRCWLPRRRQLSGKTGFYRADGDCGTPSPWRQGSGLGRKATFRPRCVHKHTLTLSPWRSVSVRDPFNRRSVLIVRLKGQFYSRCSISIHIYSISYAVCGLQYGGLDTFMLLETFFPSGFNHKAASQK